MAYGMEESSIGRKRRYDGLVHDVVQQMVAEQIERKKILKVFGEMKNELQDVKRELKERNTLLQDAKFLQRKLSREIKDAKKEVTEASMAEVEKAINGYNKTIKTVVNRHWRNIKSNKLVISDTKKTIFKIQKDLKDLRNKTDDFEQEIAFTAKLQTHVTTGSAIIFKTVITNIGGGYNSSDGMFYCPQAGLYLFSATLMAANTHYVDGKIMKNSIEIVTFHENIKINHYPSASATVLLRLDVGDKVWIKGRGIKYYFGASFFSGVLLK